MVLEAVPAVRYCILVLLYNTVPYISRYIPDAHDIITEFSASTYKKAALRTVGRLSVQAVRYLNKDAKQKAQNLECNLSELQNHSLVIYSTTNGRSRLELNLQIRESLKKIIILLLGSENRG